MATTPDLSTLDPTLVAAIQAELTARLQETFPTLDYRRGVLHDRVLYLASVLSAADRTVLATVNNSKSLLDIQTNPATADPTMVDAVLSNFKVTRLVGAPATGTVTLVVTALAPLTIPAGTQFTAGTMTFATAGAIAVRTSPTQVTATTDQVLTPLASGNYTFTIPVAATANGAAGMIRRGTALVPAQPPANFYAAYAATDFTGGVDTETNAQLIARMQAGIAAPIWSNRANILAMLTSQPAFSGLVALSAIGAGDPELGRSFRGPLPVAHAGYCDLYARTAFLPSRIPLTKTATLVGSNAQGGIWQFSLGRDEAPGFYEITQIAAAGSTPDTPGYQVLSDVRGFDRSGDPYAPDVITGTEAAYSRYQTATIQFLDTTTPIGTLAMGSAQQTYTVVAEAMPQVADLQTFLNSRAVRTPGFNLAVKGAVPCFLRVGLTIYARPGSTVDTVGIANQLAATVNATGFTGWVFSSTLNDAIASFLPTGAACGSYDLFGRLRRPDGSTIYLRNPVSIQIPNTPTLGVTPRTAVFILDPADVSVTVVPQTGPDV